MSRTIRFRKDDYLPWWNTYDWRNWVEIDSLDDLGPFDVLEITSSKWSEKVKYKKKIDPKSKEFRKNWWESHKDQRFSCKEPGPHWWRNFFERGLRKKAKNEIHKFMIDNDYEPMIESKPVLDYWM